MPPKNSKRVRSVESSAGSDPRFRAFFEIFRDAIVFTDNEGNCVDANPAATALFGCGKKELLEREIREFVVPESGSTQASPAREENKYLHGEFRLRRADGTEIDVDSFGFSDFQPGLHCSVLRDIGRRKNVERTLLETEERHQILMENAPDPILVLQDDRIVYGNSAAVQFYGARTLEQLVGTHLAQLVCPDEWPITETEIAEVLEGGQVPSHESRHVRLDGKEIPVQINAAPMLWERRPATHLIIHDISERRRAEKALHESEARLLRAQQLAHLGSWELDLLSNTLTWSDEVYRIFGLEPQEFGATYEAFLDRVHPQDRSTVSKYYSRSQREGNDSFEIEHRIIQASTQEVRWVHEKCEHFRDSEGKVIRSIGMVLDITERKQSEARQKLTADVLKVLNQTGETMPSAIREVLTLIRNWTGFDAVGLRLRRGTDYPYSYQIGFSDEFIKSENSLCQKTATGSIRFDAQGRPILECMCGLVLSDSIDQRLPFFTDGGSFWTSNSSELSPIQSDADLTTDTRNRCIRAGYKSFALVPVRSGREMMGLLQLNDRRSNQLSLYYIRFLERLGDQLGLALKRMQVQEELRLLNQSLEQQVAERTEEIQERSEQLRMLALELTRTEQRERQRLAEVLHEGLQQILVAVKYRLALIENAQDLKQLSNEVSSMIDNAIDMSRSLTAELSPPILRQSGLLAGLEWLSRWMHDKHGLILDLEFHETSMSLPQDLSLFLFQAVRELLFNVVKHAGVNTAILRVDQQRHQIRVAVEDAGAGFDLSRQRITGGTDQVQGFGLFSLRERINTIGGVITIDSAPHRGTRILLQLPIPEDAAKPRSETCSENQTDLAEKSDIEAHTSIRVFLVDDHIVVRQGLAGLIKCEEDMEVVGEASDGKSAVERVRELKPDVVLMDVSMPVMDGIEATRIIHRDHPNIQIIGLSMFAAVEQANAMREAGAVGYLTKSGPSEQLLGVIRSQGTKAIQKKRPIGW